MLSCLSCISWRRCSNTPSVSHTWKRNPMVASHWPVTSNFALSISACRWYFQLLTHQAGVLLDVSYGFSFVYGHHFYCCLLIKYWLWALYLFMWNTHRCFKKYAMWWLFLKNDFSRLAQYLHEWFGNLIKMPVLDWRSCWKQGSVPRHFQ